jgi:hypothetical protein
MSGPHFSASSPWKCQFVTAGDKLKWAKFKSVWAYDSAGNLLWTQDTSNRLGGWSPTVVTGYGPDSNITNILTTRGGQTYNEPVKIALSIEDGSIVWRKNYSISESGHSDQTDAVGFYGDNIILAVYDVPYFSIISIDPAGDIVWRYTLPDDIFTVGSIRMGKGSTDNFGNTVFIETDGFLDSLNHSGYLNWRKQIVAVPASIAASSVSVNPAGDIWVSTGALNRYTIGGVLIWSTAISPGYAFLKVDNRNFTYFWSRTGGGLDQLGVLNTAGVFQWFTNSTNQINDIAFDSNNNVIVASTPGGTVKAIESYDTAGNLNWAYDTDIDYGYLVKVDSDDNIIVIGSNADGALVYSLDSSGNLNWTTDGGPENLAGYGFPFAYAGSLTVDKSNNIIVSGIRHA